MMPNFEQQSAFKNGSTAANNLPSSSRLKKRQLHQGTLNAVGANSVNMPNGIIGMSNKIELDPIS